MGHLKAFATPLATGGSSGPQSTASGGAERPAGRRSATCEMSHIARRGAPNAADGTHRRHLGAKVRIFGNRKKGAVL